MTRLSIAAFIVCIILSPLLAQTQPPGQPATQPPSQPTQPPAQPRPRAAAKAPAKPTSARVTVRDRQGAPIEDAQIVLAGVEGAEFTTGPVGTAIIPNLTLGTYRIHVEKKGYIPLEREFIVGTAIMTPVDVVLNEAPPPPPPPPAAEPAPKALGPAGAPVLLSIPDFLDKNFIGREQLKESILACNQVETVRLLQLKEGLASHVHDNTDEILYVVAGDGAIRLGEDTTVVRAGSLAVVPHGAAHAIERRGKNPLIVLSTLSGNPCPAGATTK
jgi:quercetin dioxygenase-like cupin family protein